ncbi:uncharacterized protein [Periplaneta americana]|uniref:uncharacterized protein n=1 Tax=Periplaneta americana TaxID=6978 RepID=UPI0037E82396
MGVFIDRWKKPVFLCEDSWISFQNNNYCVCDGVGGLQYFLLFVLAILLVRSCVERNPGPAKSKKPATITDDGSTEKKVPKTAETARTNGAVNVSGQYFEIRMNMLLLIRGVLFADEFYLASNLKSAGIFDDIVFKCKHRGKWKTYFIQLKHKTTEKDKYMVKTDIKADKPKFNILKMMTDYKKINESLSMDSSCILFRNNPEDCEYVFYTNGGIDPSLNWEICSCPHFISSKVPSDMIRQECSCQRQNKDCGVVTIQEKSESYKKVIEFSKQETGDGFVRQFRAFIGQAHVDELDEVIKSEIRRGFGTSEQEASYIRDELFKQMLNWCCSTNGGEYLTRENNYLNKIIQSRKMHICELNALMTEKINNFGIQFNGAALQELKNHIEMNQVLNVVSSGFHNWSLSTLKVYQCVRDMGIEHLIVVDLKQLISLTNEVFALWPSKWCHVLIIECDPTCKVFYNLRLLQALRERITENKRSRLIIVSGNEDTFVRSLRGKITKFSHKCTFNDLDSKSQEYILKKDILFQNNVVNLLSLTGRDNSQLGSKFNEEILIKLLSDDEVAIGKTPPCEVLSFIPRELFRNTTLDRNILLDEKQVARFLFSGISSEKLKSLLLEPAEEIHDVGNGIQSHCHYYLARDEKEARDTLKASGEVLHWIEVEEGERLTWKKSNVDTKAVRKYLDLSQKSCTKDMTTIRDDVVCVVSEPGAGKSALLQHVAQVTKRADASTWVVHVNLIEFMESCSNMNDMKELKKYLGMTGNNSDLEVSLFDHALNKTGNVVILMDEFDAASPTRTEEAVGLLKMFCKMNIRQLWVASRPIMLDLLEKEMHSLSYSITPFTEEEQVDFLLNYWNKDGIGKRDFASILIKRTHALSSESNIFTAVPMHIMMLAELFKNKEIPEQIDLLDLFEEFVEKKFEVFSHEKMAMNRRNPSRSSVVDLTAEILKSKLLVPALFSVFSPDDVKSLEIYNMKELIKEFQTNMDNCWFNGSGIIDYCEGGLPHFTHRMFAEYFSALWLYKNHESRENLLKKLLFQKGSENVRNIFDRFFARESSHHISVINNVSDMTENWISRIIDTDSGGRIPLHLAASYGRDKIARALLREAVEKQLTFRDHVLQMNPLEYAQKAKSLSVLNMIYETGHAVQSEVSVEMTADPEVPLLVLEGGYVCIVQQQPQVLHQVLEFQDDFERNSLHLAAGAEALDLMNVLLHENARLVTGRDRGGNLALHSAAQKGSSRAVKKLIEYNSQVDACNMDGNTALHIAIMKNHEPVVRILLEAGADTNIRNKNGNTSLHCAVWRCEDEVVQVLTTEGGADITLRNREGTSSLNLAIEHGRINIVSRLVNPHPVTPPPIRRLDVARFLTRGSSDINRPDEEGFTPLHRAARQGHLGAVKYFIGEGTVLNYQNISGNTPLHWAAGRGYTELVDELISAGASINSLNNNGNTPLHRAVKYGHIGTVRSLLEHSANVGMRNNTGFTPLFWAFRHERVRILRYLVDEGIGLYDVDGQGNSPLHWAVRLESCEMTRRLLWQHVDLDFRNHNGNTPLHMAVKHDRPEAIRLLLEAGAALEIRNKSGYTPLLWAVLYENLEALCLLVENGASFNVVNRAASGPLHVAVEVGSLDIVQYIVSLGIDLELVNCAGYTASALAVMYGHTEISEFLNSVRRE